MARVNPRIPHPGPSEMMDHPDTPLSAYSPGQLSMRSPMGRAKQLKRTPKGSGPGAVLTTPKTPLSG